MRATQSYLTRARQAKSTKLPIRYVHAARICRTGVLVSDVNH